MTSNYRILNIKFNTPDMVTKICKKNSIVIILLLAVAAAILYAYYRPIMVHSELRNDIQVVLYSKKACIYCQRAQKLLQKKRIPYEIVELTNNQDLIIKLVEKTRQNTVPFVFINNEFVGGYQDLVELDKNGKL